jgi:hypothetical protein
MRPEACREQSVPAKKQSMCRGSRKSLKQRSGAEDLEPDLPLSPEKLCRLPQWLSSLRLEGSSAARRLPTAGTPAGAAAHN